MTDKNKNSSQENSKGAAPENPPAPHACHCDGKHEGKLVEDPIEPKVVSLPNPQAGFSPASKGCGGKSCQCDAENISDIGSVKDDGESANKNISADNKKLEETLAQLESFKAKYLTALADLENQKKRHARERDEFLLYGNSALIQALLPVVDNFEIALRSAEEHHPEAKGLLQGLGLIIPQLLQTLKAAGVEVIAPKAGETFDPHNHQSVGEAASAEVPAHAILSLQRAGYRMHERLLRPAMVTLSSGKGN